MKPTASSSSFAPLTCDNTWFSSWASSCFWNTFRRKTAPPRCIPRPSTTSSPTCHKVDEAVIEKLWGQRNGCLQLGYDRSFCGIQMDVTTLECVEYSTASTCIISPDFGAIEHMALATQAFPARHTSSHIQLWLKKVPTILGRRLRTHWSLSMTPNVRLTVRCEFNLP